MSLTPAYGIAISVILPVVDATGGARLPQNEARELGELLLQPGPDPSNENLAGRVFESFDLIQIIVIELLPDRVDLLLDIGEVDDPSRPVADRPRDEDLDTKRVAVQATALVPFRHGR